MRYVKFFSAMVALAAAGVMAATLAPDLQVEARYQPSELEAARESIALSLLGQFQMSFSDLTWLKTLEYLHNGIIYRMPTRREEAKGVRATEFSDMGAGVAHEDGPPLVPGMESDWRGILGEFNRHVEPWRPGKPLHSDPAELIPWYQLLVKFDPHYIPAYTNGSFFMSDFARKPEMARDFLLTGAEANPWSFEVQCALGRLYFDYFEDYANAVDALAKSTELAKKEKEYLAKRGDELDEVQKQLLGEAYLFLARSYDKLGQYNQALAACNTGLKEAPEYILLKAEHRIVTKHMTEKPANDASVSVNKGAPGESEEAEK